MTTRATASRSILAAAAAIALTVTGCSTAATGGGAETSQATVLDQHGLAGLDARGIIERLDTMGVSERPVDLLASVQPDSLVLTSDDQATSIPMPDDEFYLSLAPYKSQTHECYFHSLTTCRGELRHEQVRVTVTDQNTGDTVLDETRTTYDNGFIGIWLPRGLSGALTVEHDGKTATAPISTGNDDDLTCLTSLRLD